MASPLEPTNSPSSPSLTHGGSEFSFDGSEFIDFGAYDNAPSTSTAAPVSIAASEALTSALAKTTDFSDLYNQFFSQDKSTSTITSPTFASASLFEPMPTFSPSMSASLTTDTIPFNSIDPSLVDSTFSTADHGLQEATAHQYNSQETQSDEVALFERAGDAEDILTHPEDSLNEPSAPLSPKEDGQVYQKKTRAAAKRNTAATAVSKLSKRKTKAVAELALPMPATASKARAAVPSTSAVTTEDDEAKIGAHHLPHIVFPVPDYIDRPSAEEYSKLSSKEKRQMRNKISARNFRHRRKEYIGTLEEEVAVRDQTIATLQEEMGLLRTENTSLRSDLDLLKTTVEKLLAENRAPQTPTASTSTSLLPNLSKDVSPFNTRSSFADVLPRLNVHTTLVPAAASAFALPARNMNPAMNGTLNPALQQHLPGRSEDDSFWGSNPLTLNGTSMDRYRGALYGKLAHNLNGIRSSKENPAFNFKPSFFAPFAKNAVSKDRQLHDDVSDDEEEEGNAGNSDIEGRVQGAVARQTAYVAQVATSTLAQGVFRSFWNTFVGANPHAPNAQQVADLLAGRSELRVMPAGRQALASPVEELSTSLAGLNVQADITRPSRQRQYTASSKR